MQRSSGEFISYKPIPAFQLLKEIKNLSELMINLAYCSVFFADKTLTEEIRKIEERIDYLKSILIMQAALATRDARDAERLVSIFDFTLALDKISDAAGDISGLAEDGIFINIGSEDIFPSTTTTLTYALKVSKDSSYNGKRIRELYDVLQGVFDVIAVRREAQYILTPNEDFKIVDGDVLFVIGLAGSIKKLASLSGFRREGGLVRVEEGLVDSFIHLKNISELMIDLAYSALFTRSRELADELEELEDTLDELTREFKVNVMNSKRLTNLEKIALLEIADACESIGDAAMDMTYSLRRGLEPHPIIDSVLENTEERLSLIRVGKNMAGRDIISLELDRMGMEVLAMKRGSEWLITPPLSGIKLREGDILLIRYYSEAEPLLSKIASRDLREEIKRNVQESEEKEWRRE